MWCNQTRIISSNWSGILVLYRKTISQDSWHISVMKIGKENTVNQKKKRKDIHNRQLELIKGMK